MKLSSLFSFLGSFWGKMCLLGLVGIAFWVLKIKLDIAKAKLEANKILIASLENANKNQKTAIQTLLEQQQKQNDAFYFLQQKTAEKQKASFCFCFFERRTFEKVPLSNSPLKTF